MTNQAYNEFCEQTLKEDRLKVSNRLKAVNELGGIEKEDPAVARCLEVLRQK